jgi:hypothetical protein
VVGFMPSLTLPGDGEEQTAKAGDAGCGDMGSFTPPSSLPDDGDRGRTAMAGGAAVLEGMS